jgi:hypothetical protein
LVEACLLQYRRIVSLKDKRNCLCTYTSDGLLQYNEVVLRAVLRIIPIALRDFSNDAEMIEILRRDPRTWNNADVLTFAKSTTPPAPQPSVVTADATKSKSGKLSEELRPGNLRKIIEILESGKTLTPNDISKKYGRPLTKLKHDVRRSKIEQKDDILKLLNTIKRI